MPSPAASYEPPPLSATPSEHDDEDGEGFLVLCLYDFDGQDPDQLSFHQGDVLRIVQTQDTGWWAALDPTESSIGWVPQEFVQRMSDEMLYTYTYVTNELETARASEFDTGYESPQEQSGNSLLAPDYGGQASAPVSPAGRLHPFTVVPIPGTRRASAQMTMLSEINAAVPPSPRVPVPQPIASPQTAPLYPPSHYRPAANAGSLPAHDETREYHEAEHYRPLPPVHQSRSQTAPSVPLLINKPVPPTPESSTDGPGLSRSVSESATIASMSTTARTGRRRPTPLMADDQTTLNRISMAVDAYSQRSESPAQFFEHHRPRPSFDELSVDTSTGSMSDTASTTSSRRKHSEAQDLTARMNVLQAQARLPWYLRPSYADGEDIFLEADGSVKGGNIIALVERLSVDAGNFAESKAYRHAFLLTFKSFTTADILFDLLEERYRMDHPPELNDEQFQEWREKKQKPAQTRILVVMREWLEDHNMLQEDPHIGVKLREFLMLVKSPPAQALTAKQTLQSLDRLQSTPPRDPYEATTRPGTIQQRLGRRANKSLGTDILKIEPSLLAQQLTLLEARLYSRVRPSECLAYARVGNISNGVMTLKGGDKVGPMPVGSTQNLISFCATNDKLASWVKMSVLERDGLGKRADTIDHWLKVAEKCRSLQNISSASAIIAALSSVDIRQLNLTWAHVGRTAQYQQLVRLTDPAGNFTACRALLQKMQGPCVPFIGMYLSDLIHYSERFEDTIPGTTSPNNPSVSTPFFSPSHAHMAQSPTPMSGMSSAFSPMQQQIAGNSRVIVAPASALPFSKFPLSATPMSAKNGAYPDPQQSLPLINFVKRQYIANVMDNVLRHQTKTYEISEDQHLYAYIESRLQVASSKDQGSFWLRSQEVQQAEIAHADIRRGLEQAGF
ncbi:ras GEF [Exidia glandulosa HHB12029]|uniref:Ras GEF n=1 Tax=Exidia glandulosa HHB12029 TaxID=1314781 RepID=A0A165NBD6_EXIGL|nr:ras GEF [Exidia glandulosa HHB12029]